MLTGTHEDCVMNESLQTSELSSVDRAAIRPVAAASPVQPVGGAGASGSATEERARGGADGGLSQSSEEHLASAAEYARVHASISDILAGLRSSRADGISSAGDAEQAMLALMPAPVIIVPLPPASREMVEHAAAIAREVADQAAFAQAVQARLKQGTVDQILATVA
jgi:hypothetical protein